MDIEEVAAKTPEQILTVNIHPAAGLQGYQCRQLAFGLGLKGTQVTEFQVMAMGLYKLYLEKDASLVEVNPLIVTKSGSLMALDAKNQHRRERSVPASRHCKLRDANQEDPMERRASEHDLNYVPWTGYRVHGQRRRTRNGDHGPHQAPWGQPANSWM